MGIAWWPPSKPGPHGREGVAPAEGWVLRGQPFIRSLHSLGRLQGGSDRGTGRLFVQVLCGVGLILIFQSGFCWGTSCPWRLLVWLLSSWVVLPWLSLAKSRASQPQVLLTFGVRSFFIVGSCSMNYGNWAASLASTHSMPTPPLRPPILRQISPTSCWKCPQLRTTGSHPWFPAALSSRFAPAELAKMHPKWWNSLSFVGICQIECNSSFTLYYIVGWFGICVFPCLGSGKSTVAVVRISSAFSHLPRLTSIETFFLWN